MNQQIILHKLKISTIDSLPDISISFGMEKTGLIGKNGVGKTSIIKAILNELEPSSGTVGVHTDIAYLPQDYQFDLQQSIAEAMGIKGLLETIEKVKSGSLDENLLSIVSSNWNIQDRAIALLSSFGITETNLNKTLKNLSGGERMKVKLAGLFLYPNKFLLLDEPTNNLDRDSRQALYHYITQWTHGMLVVSHDRELLNLMERIVELSEKGIKIYGGNYDTYVGQKRTEVDAGLRLLSTARQKFIKLKKQAQDVKQRQEKRTSHAKKRAKTQNIPKIILNAMKRSGEETAGKLKTVHDERVLNARTEMQKAKESLLSENQIRVDLSKTEVPKGKLVLELTDVSFDYVDTTNLLAHISLSIHGQERLAICGSNGSGKTTLVKLMLQKLDPKSGQVKIGTKEVAYLDQEVSLLNPEKTVLENVISISGLDQHSAREWLVGFLFLGKEVFKTVNCLSGGERIRAALAAILAGNNPVKLLVLDEPTNSLDLDSIERIESALMNYKGNLIVISHDQKFLDKIGIERYLTLD